LRNNRFDLFQTYLPEAYYGISSFLVSDSKIILLGGFNSNKGNNRDVIIIDLSNGAIKQIGKINQDIWSTFSPFYFNGNLYIISTGEEVEQDMPKIFEYPINLPMV
jgi:hypothetical protein